VTKHRSAGSLDENHLEENCFAALARPAKVEPYSIAVPSIAGSAST
jgi:hypothetical protein